MKWELRKIRLNNGGYDRFGSYYGVGAPLYHGTYYDEDGFAHDVFLRARDRIHARAQIRLNHDLHATFYN